MGSDYGCGCGCGEPGTWDTLPFAGISLIWKPKQRIFSLWLACHTQEEIAEREGIPQQTLADLLPKLADLPESVKPVANHLTDFTPPHYNVLVIKRRLGWK